MGILSALKGLFSGGEAAPAKTEEAIEYNGYQIVPAPMQDGGQFRVAATITLGEGEEQKMHKFIRSDLMPNRDECIEITIRKAKLTIDQLGKNLFN
ncbi:HlyU family transcriptional regulator [Marinomonas posidonica]|uniref:Transcriptional activator HlyU n=1 Tax=Marinomonas posidonica (strain CECT 7376 / NCIMB 14433 / IVIA-Po-181) TaxID=491952 RepID=F6D0S6_MARPP|nr:HlyU family transcriptional regulator [Marinomonas posidonica]AEF55958.1 Transcriptional activator HlyU [Marinomonas posidonica IVIA-Po-181]